MTMTTTQAIVTIAMCVLGTVIPRFTPFLIWNGKRTAPPYIHYLGKALPAAIFGMLVVYCLRSTPILAAPHGIPEFLAILFIVVLHLWKENMFVSMVGGTALYMILVQMVFA